MPASSASSASSGSGSTTIRQTTSFPYDSSVMLELSITADSALRSVKVRIPAWVTASSVPLQVTQTQGALEGTAATTVVDGERGTYAQVPLAAGATGATITFDLPMGLRASVYNGTQSQFPAVPVCGTLNSYARVAFEFGPILLAARYSSDASPGFSSCGGKDCVLLDGLTPEQAMQPETWLERAPGPGIRFVRKGQAQGAKAVEFVPYYTIDDEQFTVYPAVVNSTTPSPGTNSSGTCGVVAENFPAETTAVCLRCPSGERITSVVDAQFGGLEGNCSTSSPFHPNGTCTADHAKVMDVVSSMCLNKSACVVPANVKLFGPDPCLGVVKKLGVRVACGTGAGVRR